MVPYGLQLGTVGIEHTGVVVVQVRDGGDLFVRFVRQDGTVYTHKIHDGTLGLVGKVLAAADPVAHRLGVIVTALAATRSFADGVGMYRAHYNGVDTLFGHGYGAIVFKIFKLPDVVLQQCLAILADDRQRDLAPRYGRRDTPLSVLTECGVFPAQIAACLRHLSVDKELLETIHISGLAVDMILGGSEEVGVLFALAVVDLDMAAVTLRCPGRMAGVALHPVCMCGYLIHRDHPLLGELALLFEQLERLECNGLARSKMHDDLVTLSDRFGQRIAPGGEEEPLPDILGDVPLSQIRRQCLGRPSGFALLGCGIELIGVPDRQLPRIPLCRPMTILTLDLHRTEIGTAEKAVPMHIVGGMTVLTEHPFGVVDILRQVQVAFGMELGLGIALRIKGRFVLGLHKPLITHPDPLAAVVAGGTGLDGNTAIGDIMHLDLDLGRGLDGMHQHVPRLVMRDSGIVAFIIPLVGVRHMARGASDPAVVSPAVATLASGMASQTLLPQIGVDRKGGVFFHLFGCRCGRQLFGLHGEALRLFGGEPLHIFSVSLASQSLMQCGCLAAKVRIGVSVALFGTKAPHGTVYLALLGRHQVVPLCGDLLLMTHAAGVLVDPRTSRIGVEGFGTFVLPKVRQRTAMRLLFARSRRIPAVTDDTVVALGACFLRDLEDLFHHLGAVVSNLFNALMTA